MNEADAVGGGCGRALHLTGTVGRGSFCADLDLLVGPGEVVALLGPNAAGKSTALRTVAGLERLRAGRLTLAGTVLDDADDPLGVAVPPARRRVGTVFQDHRLFPHLSALANVAFGPRVRGLGRVDARTTAQRWLDRLGVGDLADRRPAQLSGGQGQRVAIARALAAEPQALLLDEPLAALDAQARGDVQRALADHLGAFPGPCVLVTHDLVDALILADRIVVLEEGRVVQSGTPAEVVRRPATQYVARLLGVNLLPGHVVGHAAGTQVAVRPSALRLSVDGSRSAGRAAGGDRETAESEARPGGWAGTVSAVLPWGEHVRVEVEGEPSAVVEMPTSAVGPDLRPGVRVRLSVDRRDVEVYPTSRR